MTQPVAKSTLVILGGDSSFIYLIQRYAERLDYSIILLSVSVDPNEICDLQPLAVIFPSVESLEDSQSLVLALTNCDIPLVVCSSLADQARLRELGADYCLLHPFVFDNFSAIVDAIASQDIRQGGGSE